MGGGNLEGFHLSPNIPAYSDVWENKTSRNSIEIPKIISDMLFWGNDFFSTWYVTITFSMHVQEELLQ